MQVSFRKLPPHWKYLLTLRQAKTLIGDLGADVRVLEFCGTASKPVAFRSWHAGRFDAHPLAGHWCFKVSFDGLPESILDQNVNALCEFALDSLNSFIIERNREAACDVSTPIARLLSIREESEGLIPSFSDRALDRRSRGRDWWSVEESLV